MLSFITQVALPLGLLYQSANAQDNPKGSFHWVADVKDFTPSWLIHSNSRLSSSIGTYMPEICDYPLSNPLFSLYYFNSSSPLLSVPSFEKMTDNVNCSIQSSGMQVIYPTGIDAFYSYILEGDQCPNKGQVKITQIDLSGTPVREVRTISLGEFTSKHAVMKLPNQLASYRGRTDYVIPHYRDGEDYFSVSRALVEYDKLYITQPTKITITTTAFNFQLQQKPVSSNQTVYSLTPHTNINAADWFYAPPYLLTAAMSSGEIAINWYKQGHCYAEKTLKPGADNHAFFDVSFQVYNESALMLNAILWRQAGYFDKSRERYIISYNGQVQRFEYLGNYDVLDTLVLQRDHGNFARGGVFTLENRAQSKNTYRLVYAEQNKLPVIYGIPTSWQGCKGLAESAESLHIVDGLIKDTGYYLGSFDFAWLQANANQTQNSTSVTLMVTSTKTATVATTPPATEPSKHTTNRHTFFQSDTTSADEKLTPTQRGLITGGAAMLLLLLASSALCCVRWQSANKPEPRISKEDSSGLGLV